MHKAISFVIREQLGHYPMSFASYERCSGNFLNIGGHIGYIFVYWRTFKDYMLLIDVNRVIILFTRFIGNFSCSVLISQFFLGVVLSTIRRDDTERMVNLYASQYAL